MFSVGFDRGVYFYAMQFIEGRSLAEVLRDHREGGRRLPPLEIAGLCRQAAEALAYAHQQGVIHRDVPSNLLLDDAGRLWVSDFGLALLEGTDLTESGDVVGTLRYLAPERFRGESGPQADVYGLGLTLYELLTGRPAFEARDRAALVRQVLSQEVIPPRSLDPAIPRDLETIVLRAIARNPGERYATAEALAEDLRRFTALEPILARRATPWQAFWQRVRRHPAIASLAALVVVSFVAGFVAVTLQWRRAVNAERLAAAEAVKETAARHRAELLAATLAFNRAELRLLGGMGERHRVSHRIDGLVPQRRLGSGPGVGTAALRPSLNSSGGAD